MLAAGPITVSAGSLEAQSGARVRAEENFRREPNGERLGRLGAGTPVVVVSSRDGWLEVVLEGWVWDRSLQVDDRQGMDLVVSEDGGENLRDAPSGNILGRLDAGTLLEELGREAGWIHVRRQGWIWEPSVSVDRAEPGPRAEPDDPASSPVGPGSARPIGFSTAGSLGATILSAPDGDTLAVTAPGAEVETLAREGSWVRVRIEGWSWMPETDVAPAPAEGDPLTPDEVRESPSAHRGRVVAWRLQFISVERAERVRSDFFEGEPFLLCRFGDSQGPFIYVAVPPERLDEVTGLVPLEFVTVTGRVRTGASSLTGTPIVDLISFQRTRDGA
jgi:hypothetical protein